eukprot:gnl/Chilomastix_caulleri/516.p1 GENE.gnl/Chilomastix_caulleri/516~~gnl/Chilomastix_caulleri/516.p1  ORF type:complete len:84 (-),score=24.79 gnl/Chilomastix_caulleri/516:219-470(-)
MPIPDVKQPTPDPPTPDPPTPDPPLPTPTSSGMTAEAIAFLVLMVVFLVISVVFIVIFLVGKKKNPKLEERQTMTDIDPANSG